MFHLSSVSHPRTAASMAAHQWARRLLDRLNVAQLDDVNRLARRLLRRPSVTRNLFFEAIDDVEERHKLACLARDVRGPGSPPALFLHGVLPRSGTNYVSSLLARHPDIVADPIGLHELPLLVMLEDIKTLQRRFLLRCEANRGALDRHDFLAILANGIIAAADRQTLPGQRLLFRSPHARMLPLFPVFFPGDQLIVLLRDGRDVITSTQATWRGGRFGKTFHDLCLEWTYATHAALTARDELGAQRCHVVRYEDVVRDPVGAFVDLCRFVAIDPDKVSHEHLHDVPVKGSSEVSKIGSRVTWDPIARPADFNPIGRWQSWPARQHRIFWSIAGDAMVRAGYGRCL